MKPFEKKYDFDKSSSEWMKNKVKLGNGQYKYVCGYICKSGKKCLRKPSQFKKACAYHYKLIIQVGNSS
jgi:hypothetical protein